MCPSIYIFAYAFDMKVLHHITVMKCVSVCPKIILGAGLVVDVKLYLPGLHAHLIWTLLIFPVGIFENRSPYHYSHSREELCYWIQQVLSEIKTTSSIFGCLQLSFSHRAELYVCEHWVHFEHPLWESKNKLVINRSFVYFLLLHNLLNSRSIEGVDMEVEIRIQL